MTQDLSKTFQGPSFTVTFLYYFALTALIGSVASIEVLHLSWQAAEPYQYGIIVALPFALLSAFTKRTKQIEFAFKNPNQFKHNLNQVLVDLGYEVSEDDVDPEDPLTYLTYERPGLAKWFAAKVYIAIAQQKAVIASRASFIKRLQQQL